MSAVADLAPRTLRQRVEARRDRRSWERLRAITPAVSEHEDAVMLSSMRSRRFGDREIVHVGEYTAPGVARLIIYERDERDPRFVLTSVGQLIALGDEPWLVRTIDEEGIVLSRAPRMMRVR